MSAGLFGLLDDVAALARLAAASLDDVGAAAAKASAKAAGVVVDDTAVTPQYVQGVAAEREVPIILRIAKGSLRNKLLFILPAVLVLSEFLPGLLTPLLMIGGTYLCYEGAEKIWERISGHHASVAEDVAQVGAGKDAEEKTIASAIRTDFILSAEIMVISLNEVTSEPFFSRAVILVLVAFGITALVYGVVAVIVKMDDVGLSLAGRQSTASQKLGRTLVLAMPKVLNAISVIGVAAMLWVGGHIVLNGLDELGWSAPYDLVHHIEHEVEHAVDTLSSVFGWLANTFCSMVFGLALGAVVVLVMHFVPKRGKAAAH